MGKSKNYVKRGTPLCGGEVRSVKYGVVEVAVRPDITAYLKLATARSLRRQERLEDQEKTVE